MIQKLFSQLTGNTYKPQYKIKREIFSAAFSNIYEARDRRTGSLVILKILNEAGEKLAGKMDAGENTKWEGELMLTLDHPNIPVAFDCDSGKKYWIAMEYLDSMLYSYVNSGRDSREEAELIEIFHDIASAISYLHDRGVIHRDIAPDNIMMKGDTAKLIDFGMAIPVGSKVGGGKVGTPSYMPPEMIRKMSFSPAGDIYSFGVVMYEIVTGIKLFSGKLKEERMTRVLNVHPLSPSKLEKVCSHELEKLIMSCVSKEPEKRPQNAHIVVEKLNDMRKGGKTKSAVRKRNGNQKS